MSERGALAALLFSVAGLFSVTGLVTPAAAEPSVTILDLPFRARALRGPGSEVAVAVATSGVLPIARPKGTSAEVPDPGALIAVVWGDGGGAVLGLADNHVTTTLLGAETVEGLAAAETPRGALPGSRRAVLDGLGAHLAGPISDPADGPARARDLVVRERQPVAMGGDPKPVPIATATVTAAPDAAFALRRPRIVRFDGGSFILAVTVTPSGGASLALVGHADGGLEPDKAPQADKSWTVLARGAAQAPGPGGQPLKPAGIADFSGTGRPQIAAVAAPDGAGLLQVWAYEAGALRLAHEAPGYTDVSPGEGEADLSAVLDPAGQGPPDLALPVSDRSAVAILSLKDGIRERARVTLPAPAAFGLATLGRGEGARLLVGLSDGRIAVVSR